MINDPDSPGSDDRIRELEQKVADLEDIINKFMSNANFSGGGKPREHRLASRNWMDTSLDAECEESPAWPISRFA